MARLLRHEKAGALFTERFDSLEDLRKVSTVVGAFTMARGRRDKPTVQFNGTERITYGTKENIRFNGATQDFSVFLWYQTDTSGVTQYLIDHRDTDNDGWRFVHQSNGALLASVNTVDAFSSVGAVVDTNWHMAGFTADRNGNMQVYVDGVASGAAVSINGETLVITGSFNLGYDRPAIASYFDGMMSDMTIWDRVLSAAEVLQLYNDTVFDCQRSLVSHWEMSDINPVDVGYRGFGNDLTSTGIAGTDIVPGPYKNLALDLDGATESPGSAATYSSGGATAWTHSIVMKLDTVAAFMTFAAHGVAGKGYDLKLRNTGVVWISLHNAAWYYGVTSPLVADRWHILTCSYSNANPVCVVDDTVYTPALIFGTPIQYVNNDGASMHPAGQSTAERIDGMVAAARTYSIAMTPLQILDLHARIKTGRA